MFLDFVLCNAKPELETFYQKGRLSLLVAAKSGECVNRKTPSLVDIRSSFELECHNEMSLLNTCRQDQLETRFLYRGAGRL